MSTHHTLSAEAPSGFACGVSPAIAAAAVRAAPSPSIANHGHANVHHSYKTMTKAEVSATPSHFQQNVPNVHVSQTRCHNRKRHQVFRIQLSLYSIC